MSRDVLFPSLDQRVRAGVGRAPQQEVQGAEPEPPDVRVVSGAVCRRRPRPGRHLLLSHAGKTCLDYKQCYSVERWDIGDFWGQFIGRCSYFIIIIVIIIIIIIIIIIPAWPDESCKELYLAQYVTRYNGNGLLC